MAIETVTILTGTALYWLGFLSGFGFGLTKRRKLPPPLVDVPEETMQAFERYMEASIVFDKDIAVPATTLH